MVVLLFNAVNNASVVSAIFKVATYTYGPLIGLFAFSIFSKSRQVFDRVTPLVCIVSPLITFFIDKYSKELLGGYVFAEELIIVNGLITFIGLFLFSKRKDQIENLSHA